MIARTAQQEIVDDATSGGPRPPSPLKKNARRRPRLRARRNPGPVASGLGPEPSPRQLNHHDNNDTVEPHLKDWGPKLDRVIPAASYGSWFQYYACIVSGKISIEQLGLTIPILPLPGTQIRCATSASPTPASATKENDSNA